MSLIAKRLCRFLGNRNPARHPVPPLAKEGIPGDNQTIASTLSASVENSD
jgi:hypothetical protein